MYLTAKASSIRVAQFLDNEQACVSFCNFHFFKGLMLKGRMELLTDSASKEMISREGDAMYYPKGVTDSGYCV